MPQVLAAAIVAFALYADIVIEVLVIAVILIITPNELTVLVKRVTGAVPKATRPTDVKGIFKFEIVAFAPITIPDKVENVCINDPDVNYLYQKKYHHLQIYDLLQYIA